MKNHRHHHHHINVSHALIAVILFVVVMVAHITADPIPITELGKQIKDQHVGKDKHIEYTAKVKDLMPDLSEDDLFTVMLTPLSGDADLCLTTNEKELPEHFDKDVCDWHSAGGHGDTVIIPRKHEKWPKGDDGRFNIGVYGRTASNYMINTWTSETFITLEPGITQNAQVTQGKYVYMKFKLPKGKGDFHIGVTPQTGDPDLYVSTEIEKPTKEQCSTETCWISAKANYDVILIKDTDPKFKPEGEYNIAIYAWRDTAFIVYATPKDEYTILPEGYPISDAVERGEYRYYKFWMTTSEITQTWTLDPITQGSDPDIYVRMQRDEDDKGEGEDKPSKEAGKYDWKSNTVSKEALVIEKAKGDKWYYTAVYGYGKMNTYRIVAGTEQSSTMLSDGSMQTVTALSPGRFFFKYHHGDDQSAVTFTASGVNTEAQLDMYYSSEISDPDKDKNEGVGEKMGSKTYMYFPTPTRVGTYYLSVAVDRACNFTMLAGTNQTMSVLQDNVLSFFNYAPAKYYRYFVFDHEKLDHDLTISVDPWLDGEVDLYVSNTTTQPTKEKAEWKSENYKQDTVVIYSDELKRMQAHRFYIGVYARYDSYFSIIAYSAAVSLELEDGLPVTGIVKRGDSRFYKFRVNNRAAITITLRISDANADGDLYADFNNEKPSPSDHAWKGISIGDDVIFIEEFDGEHNPWLYIGVRGIYGPDGEVPFQLEVKQKYQIMRPNWGQLIQVTPQDKSTQFMAVVYNYADFVVLSTTLINGRTKMYVNTNGSVEATPENADFSSEDWPANAIVVKSDDPKFRPGQWSVTVQAVENSDYFISLVQKTEWSFGSPLKETVPHVGRVPAGQSVLYNYYMPYDPSGAVKEDWILNVNTMSGDIDVFVGQDYMHVPPTKDNHTFASYGPNDRVMVMSKSKLISSPLFISVHGRNSDLSDSVFELTISEHDATRYLPIDQPQQFVASSKDVHYHVVAPVLNKTEQMATVVIESCDTLRAPNLYGSAENSKPSPRTNFTSRGVSMNNHMKQVMTGLIPVAKDKNSDRVFYITVEGDVHGSRPTSQMYSISTTFQDSVPEPIIASRKDRFWSVSASNRDKMKIEIYRSQAPPRFSQVALQYDVYLAEVNKTQPAEQVNMVTVCGVQLFGKRVASVKEDQKLVGNADTVTLEFDMDRSKTYMVNVLVHNGFGVYNIYHQSWIIKGRFHQNYPSSFLGFLSPLSLGFFLILFFTLGVALYLIVGAIVQKTRGKEGFELIPNYYFWKDLPHLIVDGVRLIGSLFVRRSKQYSEFMDEPDTVNTTGFDTAASVGNYGGDEVDIEDQMPRDNVPSGRSGGYGAI